MIAFLKLIRYKNLLMVLLTMVLTKYALIDSLHKNNNLSNLDFSILAISVLLISAGGYIINDFFDIEADKINKPNKVFIGTSFSKRNAWKIYLAFTFLGIILGVILSFIKNLKINSLYFITIGFSLYFYSKKIKHTPLLGNILISIFCGFIIYLVSSFELIIYNKGLIDNIALNNMHNYMLGSLFIKVFICFSFLTTLIREIIKDIEDINGDLKIKAKTLPIVIGRKRAAKVAFLLSCVLLFFLFLLLQAIYKQRLFFVYGIVFILLPLLYFMFHLWKAERKKDFSRLSSLLKMIIFLGILSMLLFKFQ